MKYQSVPGTRKLTTLHIILLSLVLVGACSVAEPKTSANADAAAATNVSESANVESAPRGATIEIDEGGPADTVRVFYKHLRERKFREAIFLTNLRPAIEGLTENELKGFSMDFETIAGQVPPEIEINGEIITGDQATVTANLPNEDGDKNEIQTIKLKKTGDVWMILSVDEEAEARIRREGGKYFYNLRIETHEQEAKKMLERVSKAQLAHSLQNGGLFTDMQELIAAGLLPGDITTSDSTGYNYAVNLAADKKKYFATATPAVYGTSGRYSFILQLDGKGISHVTGKDTRGKPMSK